MEKSLRNKQIAQGVGGMLLYIAVAQTIYFFVNYVAFGFLESAAVMIFILLAYHYKHVWFRAAFLTFVVYILALLIGYNLFF